MATNNSEKLDSNLQLFVALILELQTAFQADGRVDDVAVGRVSKDISSSMECLNKLGLISESSTQEEQFLLVKSIAQSVISHEENKGSRRSTKKRSSIIQYFAGSSKQSKSKGREENAGTIIKEKNKKKKSGWFKKKFLKRQKQKGKQTEVEAQIAFKTTKFAPTRQSMEAKSQNQKSGLQQPEMSLTSMAEFLARKDGLLTKQLDECSEAYRSLAEEIELMEKDLKELEDKPELKERLTKTKELGNVLLSKQSTIFDDIKKTQSGMHDIIEQLAVTYGQQDIHEFIQRETHIPLNIAVPPNEGEPEILLSDTDASQGFDRELQRDQFFSIYEGLPIEESKNTTPTRSITTKSIGEEDSASEQDPDSDIEDLFLDAVDEIQRASVHLNASLRGKLVGKDSGIECKDVVKIIELVQEENQESIASVVAEADEPKERRELPWFKDPNIKVSIWAIIKDSIGKDISKLTVPVYFNDPTSLLQKCAQSMEYNSILDQIAELGDVSKRLAYMAVYSAAQLTICERNCTKPFNPLLGETYEFVTDDFEFLSEQVSHHPPITANYCRGKKSKYVLFNNQKTNSKFTGKSLDFTQAYRTYVEYEDLQEKYEITAPTLGAHNLIIGAPYVDIGGSSTIRILGQPDLKCSLRFHKRGWFSKEEFKVEGEVVRNSRKKKKHAELLYKIHGNWNASIYVTPYDSNGKLEPEKQECVFKKDPYPEQWAYMYGMSHFSLQLNYFPKRLLNVVAPTDTRRRPDQRCLEQGEMIMAATEKERLEGKQRAVRKYKEKNKMEHEAAYFIPWENKEDGKTYYIYNGKYFGPGQDQETQDWSRLPDLFSEELPEAKE